MFMKNMTKEKNENRNLSSVHPMASFSDLARETSTDSSSFSKPARNTLDIIKIIQKRSLNDINDGTTEEDQIESFLRNVKKRPRTLTISQKVIRGKLLRRGSTPQTELRKQVIIRRTHIYLIYNLLLVAVLSVFLTYFGLRCFLIELKTFTSDSHVGIFFATAGLMMMASTLIGIIGAARVTEDILHDDMGIGTPGQRLLEYYFYLSFLFLVLITPMAVLTLQRPQLFLGDSTYDQIGVLAYQSAVCSICLSLVSMFSLKSTVMIVTVYEMTHSFLECFCTLLVSLCVIGLFMMTSSLDVGYQLSFHTTANSEQFTKYLFVISYLLLSLIIVNVVGFFGAVKENAMLLRMHVTFMSLLAVMLFVSIILLSLIDFSSVISENCRFLLQTISHVWWRDALECSKYQSSQIGGLVETFTEGIGYHYATGAQIGLASRCPAKRDIAFAWEYGIHVQSDLRNTRSQLNIYPAYGCLQIACCSALSNLLDFYVQPVIVSLVSLLLNICISICSAMWLLHHIQTSIVDAEKLKMISNKRVSTLLAIICISISALVGISVKVFQYKEKYQVTFTELLDDIELESMLNESSYFERIFHSCDNMKRDGNETDIDCGGGVGLGGCTTKCREAQRCILDSDCESNLCSPETNTCIADKMYSKCTNGVHDGSETDVDCGGYHCQKLEYSGKLFFFLCETGQKCVSDTDCRSNSCDRKTYTCVSCYDNRTNGEEGDTDCGSSTCVRNARFSKFNADRNQSFSQSYPQFKTTKGSWNASNARGLCISGKRCANGLQCSSGTCVNEKCASCTNNILDGDETDIDCGGDICHSRCKVGKSCRIGSDCTSGRCTGSCKSGTCYSGTCVFALNSNLSSNSSVSDLNNQFPFSECSNGKKTEDESDIDCGGVTCASIGKMCQDGGVCRANTDCESGYCDITSKVCVSCYNGFQDGEETDIDCGGTECPKRCSFDEKCKDDSDCGLNLFCWTPSRFTNFIDNIQLAFQENITKRILQNFYLPEINTCQLLTKLPDQLYKQVPSVYLDSQNVFTESMGSIFFNLIGRKNLDNFQDLSRAAHPSLIPFPGLFQGIPPNREGWSVACKASLSIAIDTSAFRLKIMSTNGTDIQLSTDKKRATIVIQLFDSVPTIQLEETSCFPQKLAFKVHYEIIIEKDCGLISPNQFHYYSMIAPLRTLITGSIKRRLCSSQRCQEIQNILGAKIKIFRAELTNSTKLKCKNRLKPDDTLNTPQNLCPEVNCSSVENCSSFSRCCYVNAPAETSYPAKCIGQGKNTAKVVAVTDQNGIFSVQWPEIHEANLLKTKSHNIISLSIFADGYYEQTVMIRVIPGRTNQLGDIFLVEELSTLSPTAVYPHLPTHIPTKSPNIGAEYTSTYIPSKAPTIDLVNTEVPLNVPASTPTSRPIRIPTTSNLNLPSFAPSFTPTSIPNKPPNTSEVNLPSVAPSFTPTTIPSKSPNAFIENTGIPTYLPTYSPSFSPTFTPTFIPSKLPTAGIGNVKASPTNAPTYEPTSMPSNNPSFTPSYAPTTTPSSIETNPPSISGGPAPPMTPTVSPNVDCQLDPVYHSNIETIHSLQHTCNNCVGTDKAMISLFGWIRLEALKNENILFYSIEGTATNVTESYIRSLQLFVKPNGGIDVVIIQDPPVRKIKTSFDTYFKPDEIGKYIFFGFETWRQYKRYRLFKNGNIFETRTGSNFYGGYNCFPSRNVNIEIGNSNWHSNSDVSMYNFYLFSERLSSEDNCLNTYMVFDPPKCTFVDPCYHNEDVSAITELPLFNISGSITETQTMLGLEAYIELYDGNILTFWNETLLKPRQTSFSLSKLSEMEKHLHDDGSSHYISGSTFSFSNIPVGSYTLVFYHAPGVTNKQISYTSRAFSSCAHLITVSKNQNYNFSIMTEVPKGEMYTVLEYSHLDDLDLMVHFTTDYNLTGNCVVGGKMLSDNATKCGDSVIVRDDFSHEVSTSTSMYDVLHFRKLHKTIYRFFLARTSTTPINIVNKDKKLWRDDGRCGSKYPLANGEISRCPVIAVKWGDNTTSLRPCCGQDGYCGATPEHCECRHCIDHRTFESEVWQTDYRKDGLCRSNLYRTSENKIAHCPTKAVPWDGTEVDEIRPCCGSSGLCGNQPEHCNCEGCLDYRKISNLNATDKIDTPAAVPTEHSKAKVKVYTSEGLVKEFYLPDPSTSANYFDGYNFDGTRTDSSTYVRVFCFDASMDNINIKEYVSPRFYKWQTQMLEESENCSPSDLYQQLHVSGFSNDISGHVFDTINETVEINGLYERVISKVDVLFKKGNVFLYRIVETPDMHHWYFDSNDNPDDGYYVWGLDTVILRGKPHVDFRWFYLLSWDDKSHREEDLKELKFTLA